MSPMAALSFDLTPYLVCYGPNVLDTQTTGVIDPVKVIKIPLLCLILPERSEHVGRYSPLWSFLNRQESSTTSSAARHNHLAS